MQSVLEVEMPDNLSSQDDELIDIDLISEDDTITMSNIAYM